MPEEIMTNAAWIYGCEKCGKKWLMWLEYGVEADADNAQHCPVTITCACGGTAVHVDPHKDIKLPEAICSNTYGSSYFRLDRKGFENKDPFACAIPVINPDSFDLRKKDLMYSEKRRKEKMKIAIDFDGTCVTHDYPRIGKDIGAVPVLKRFAAEGHLLILNTMRSGAELEDAVNWFEKQGIPLYGVNEDPGQGNWTDSPKVFAHVYIDDGALGCPLRVDGRFSKRPFVDWDKVESFIYDNAFSPCPDPVV